MEVKKILVFIPNLLSGGAERIVVDLVNEFSLVHHVQLMIFYNEETLPNQIFLKAVNDGIKVVFLNKRKGYDFSLFKKIKKSIADFKPDIIHTHLGSTFRYVAPILWLLKNKVVGVHTVHNEADKEVVNQRDQRFRLFFFKKGVIYPVTISKKNTESFVKLYPNVAYSLIRNGRRQELVSTKIDDVTIEVESHKKDKNTKVFLFVGRLSIQKNPVLLLESFERLIASGANAILLIIGRLDDLFIKESMFKLIAKEDNKQRIFYLGEKFNVYDYLKVSDFFCMSSIYEGMPISLIEAFAYGVVPVTTPVGALPEMIHGYGFVSEDINMESYYRVLSSAYSISGTTQSAISNQLTKLFREKYDITICANNYISLFDRLLKK